jgi:hypothetical protein
MAESIHLSKILDCYDLLFPFRDCFVIVDRGNFMQMRKRREKGKTEISGRSNVYPEYS